ncbi:MAG: rRNA maturation RNase YbeY [Candidatus Dormiibacterota bacterium]
MRLLLASALSRAERDLVKAAALDALLSGALVDLELPAANLNCRLTDPLEIRRLNRRFANQDEVTDVLAFAAVGEEGAPGFQIPPSEADFLGDIVISVATAAEQADLAGVDAASEIRLLAVHGLLHLLGHDHHQPEPASRMTAATRRLLSRDASRRGVPAPRVPALQAQA